MQASSFKFEYVIFISVYAIAAYFNWGYSHPDEHYQLIEFAGLKLGWNNTSDLAWEYRTMIRSTLQVWICVIWFKLLGLLGVHDPYGLAFSLRLLSAAVTLVVMRFFIRSTKRLLMPTFHKMYVYLSHLLWFIPLVSVRFSSETWSGLSFLVALAYVVNEKEMKGRYYWIGLPMGLSFLFRFQAGILVLGLLLWMLLVKGDKWRDVLVIVTFMAFVVQLGILLDTAFYGKYTYTFWNYFQVNILQSVASNFGISPWTTLLAYLWRYPLWPIGLIIVGAIVILFVRKPTNIFLWCLLPFLVVHALIPHKELRFLFPAVWLIPIIVMLTIQIVGEWWKTIQFSHAKWLIQVYSTSLLLLNVYALVLAMVKPAGIGQKYLTKYIAEEYGQRPINLFHTAYGNPYEPWSGLTERFYRQANVSYTRVDNVTSLNGLTMHTDTIYLLALKRFERTSFLNGRLDEQYIIQLEAQSIPGWIERLSRGYVGANSDAYLELYSLQEKTNAKD